MGLNSPITMCRAMEIAKEKGLILRWKDQNYYNRIYILDPETNMGAFSPFFTEGNAFSEERFIRLCDSLLSGIIKPPPPPIR